MGFVTEYLEDIIQEQINVWQSIGETPRHAKLLDDIPKISIYQIIPKDKALDVIIGDAQIIVAPGGHCGDEAKGKVGNALADRVSAVFRLNSFQNTGRTAYDKAGRKFIFHVVPSAIIEGKESYIGPEVCFDPVTLMEREVQQLVDAEVEFKNKLFVGNSHITLPYHRIIDVLTSIPNSSTCVGARPAAMSMYGRRSVRVDDVFNHPDELKVKISRDMKERYTATINLFMKEMGIDSHQGVVKLLEERKKRDPRVVPDHVLEFAKAYSKSEDVAIEYISNMLEETMVQNETFPTRVNVNEKLNNLLAAGKKVLLEPTQSFYLSVGTEVNGGRGVSAGTSAGEVIAAGVIPPGKYKVKILPVFKAPGASKVGWGDIPGGFTTQVFFSEQDIINGEDVGGACPDFEEIRKRYFDAIGDNGLLRPTVYDDPVTGNKFDIGSAMAMASARTFGEEGATTKKPRVTGLYDCVMAAHVAKRQGNDSIITCLDRADLCEKVGLVVGYVVHIPDNLGVREDGLGRFIDSNGTKYRTGDIVRPGDELPNKQVLNHCKPIIKVVDGCKDSPIGAKSGFNQEILPENAAKIISTIEYHTRLNIVAIGNGTGTDDMLYLRKPS